MRRIVIGDFGQLLVATSVAIKNTFSLANSLVMLYRN